MGEDDGEAGKELERRGVPAPRACLFHAEQLSDAKKDESTPKAHQSQPFYLVPRICGNPR